MKYELSRLWALIIGTLFLLPTCTALTVPVEHAAQLAGQQGFVLQLCRTGQYDLVTFVRKGTKNNDLVIYLEGDGLAWKNRYTPSRDPSPRNPVGLRLALLDPAPAVAYIARPCQYTGGVEAKNCDVSAWTSDRFSEDVVAAMNSAVSQVKKDHEAVRIHLVGYSGGGAIAMLIAGRRQDVATIRTVAGNIDHAIWTAHHGITPLYGSLNPATMSAETCHIPQMHYFGATDTIIPPTLFSKAVRQTPCASSSIATKIVPGCSHSQGWVAVWPQLSVNFYKRFGVFPQRKNP